MTRDIQADSLHERVDAAALRSLQFLGSLQAEGAPKGVLRFSPHHDQDRWPGMLLPGTYNGIMCLDLLSGLDGWSSLERQSVAGWLLDHRREDGVFRIPGMTADTVYKKPDQEETWRYIDFHVTNYAIGAVEALCPDSPPVLEFAKVWLDPLHLKAWLADRDLRDPWQEGNNIVNLASFFLLLQRSGDEAVRERATAAIAVLLEWHDRLQDPSTGFWGVRQSLGGEALLHAMAGSMHNFHIWYALDRTLPYHARALDYVLDRDPSWHSACIDVDEVDLLVHGAHLLDHRRNDIDDWLTCKLSALLAGQDASGGFADTNDTIWRQDGWPGGPAAAPGAPTTFATWFRWIAIAMIDAHLWPGRRNWKFRTMIGIGYLKGGRSD